MKMSIHRPSAIQQWSGYRRPWVSPRPLPDCVMISMTDNRPASASARDAGERTQRRQRIQARCNQLSTPPGWYGASRRQAA